MKKFWVDARKWDKKIVTTALESSADAVVVEKGFTPKVKELGLIKTIAEDGDMKLKKDIVDIEINSKQDEINAAKIGKTKTVILKTNDWSIIPIENLIAQDAEIVANVKNAKEAKTALEILEVGASGILLSTTDLNEIKKTGRLLKEQQEKLTLVKAKITKIEAVGSGDRACVDTCTNMVQGQGMLVGNSSSGMFLVHSESVDNPYVAARPFRVNAGGVHAYVKVTGNKTKYLSEIKSGDKVLVVDSKGNTTEAIVGRNKIEKRPMMLVEARTEDKEISLILQNAETIRLVKPNGKPISVVNIKTGDEVLVYTESAGRHFGMKIDETINEK
ncbi:MAG: 3-dehydroquinate synthase II [Candidatus Aenigmarchaeota archaeon]|nr:3-dehydroquinate synthase II [Candidatus Aenigmarchaeota archaeon]